MTIREGIERQYGVVIKDEDFISPTVFMTYGAYKDGVLIAKECTLPELETALEKLEQKKTTAKMELKKYVRLEDKRIIDTTKFKAELNTFMGNMTERVLINTIWYEPEATSDNILDLAEEGDLVEYKGWVLGLYTSEVENCLYFDWKYGRCYLQENRQDTFGDNVFDNISMLYKKVGNNYIGHEVK